MKNYFCICTILILAAVMNVAAMEEPFDEPWRFPIQTEGFSAGDAENVEFVSVTPGACYAVTVESDIAYIGAGVYLLILDITDKSAPALLGSVQLTDIVEDIAVLNGYAYIADGGSGLRIVDVSNPENPYEVGFDDTEPAYGVAVSGDYVYIAGGGLFCIVDVSNPENPYKVEFCDTPGSALGVAVSDDYAYIANGWPWEGLYVVDVSDPKKPKCGVGFCDTPESAYGVAVSGGYVYIADGYSGLCIADVSDPRNPKCGVGFCEPEFFACDVAISGDYAYIADNHSGLCIVDVGNPVAPKCKVGFYDTPGWAVGVAISGNYAYIADGSSGLRIVDVSNPENPYEIGSYDTPGEAVSVAVSGGYAYIADGSSGLRVVDVSNPENPDEVGLYNTPGWAHDVAVSCSYAYIADAGSGLRVVDVCNPENPYEIGSYDTPGSAGGVAVFDGYAYIADGYTYPDSPNGLRVIDICNPENPTETGFCDTPGRAYGVAVSYGYAYIADYDSGLRVINVSNPKNPTETGFCDTPGRAYGVAVSYGYAYIADCYSDLRVIDVSNPKNPTEIGFYDMPDCAQDVAVSGGYAYIADFNSGLRVVDVSNPGNPNEVGFYDTPGLAEGVAVANDLVYVADDDGGMSILRFTAAELSVSFISPSTGPAVGGTWVTIYGTNFKEGVTVTIGGNDAINPVVDPIAEMFITAVTPPGAGGPADVVVTNPDEESATLEDGFIYIPTGDVSANGTVSAYDAALILQYVVGLITEFPVDQLTSPSDVTPQNYELCLPNLTAKAGERIYVPLQLGRSAVRQEPHSPTLPLNEVSGLFAGGVTIKYDVNLLQAVNVRPSLSGVYHESNISRSGEIRFAFATAKPVNSASELLMVEFYVMPNTEGKISQLLISDAQLSESLSIVKHNGLIEVLPAKTALLPNYPNPFNPETWIPYQLSAESDVTVEIYNLQGRLVRVFDLGMQPAGSYLTKDRAVYWNGKNEAGERVASGVYFYRLKAVSPSPGLSLRGRGDYAEHPEAGTFSAVRRLVVVK